MNILHIIGGHLSGGAARGAYWLHRGLLELGVSSKVFTNSRETHGDTTVVSITQNKKGKLFALVREQADFLLQTFYSNRKRIIFSTGFFGSDFTRTKSYKEADIVHLHWICSGMVNIRHLSRVNKPIVWTMRDMWPMTGGCHYAMECEGYLTGCGKCPQLDSSRELDLSRLVVKRKQRRIPKNIKLIGISRWLSECARKSALFQDFDIRTIHNNVNTQDFFPVHKPIARQILGLPPERPIILAGTQNFKDFYKGFTDYLMAVRQLKSDPLLLLFGKSPSDITRLLSREYVSLGFLHDTVSLRLAYSAADVFVAPSRMDAFGKTLAESMACGTPVVCFDATGPKDIVDHKINGYKAKPFDAEDLARGMDWALNESSSTRVSDFKQKQDADFSFLTEIGRQAREKAVRQFDSKVASKRYVELYREILGQK